MPISKLKMTQQRFTEILLYPHLDKLPDEAEVQHALVRYPYCQSLHILVAKMHSYTNHTNAELSLNRAATYSTDRTFLYHTMQNLHTPKPTAMPQQIVDLTAAFDDQILVLEEPPMSEFEILVAPPKQTTSSTLSFNESPKNSPIETTSATEPLVILPIEEIELPEEEIELPEEEIKDMIDTVPEEENHLNVIEFTDNEVIEEPDNLIEQQENTHKKIVDKDANAPDFMEWLSGLEAPEVYPFENKNKIKTVKKAPVSRPATTPKVMMDKGKRLKKLIEKSLDTNDEIISETLAELLVLQGKKKKAIKMYQQLSLKFPEKSANFAAQIKKLTK